MRALWGLALADFRERVRRPAYLLMLISAIGLGLLAVPPVGSHWSVLVIGGFRGRYTSGYVGLVTALTSALWLTLVGFYLVRDAVARDERTGVGQLLAASPLRTPVYLAGKLLSNAMVLGSMTVVLAATALALQLLRGESRAVDPVALALPFVLVALPMLVLTGALAVFFEATPLLRGGLGNVLWFFVWMVVAIGGQSTHAPLGGIGLQPVDLPSGASRDVGLGLMYVDDPLRTFEHPGLRLDAGFLAGRLALTAVAVAIALLPALWFHRFDRPARAAGRAPAPSRGPSTGACRARRPGAAARGRGCSPASCASWCRARRCGGGWARARWPWRASPSRPARCWRSCGSGPCCCGRGWAPSRRRRARPRSSPRIRRRAAGCSPSGARACCWPRQPARARRPAWRSPGTSPGSPPGRRARCSCPRSPWRSAR
ncbi:ABC transporter permease [Dactylosporangium darangshiense]|uniref:ABC transporter permease n=1 Tax=Dactylosporangium darangshiense TaxID=579108 RepID=UPI0036434EBA